MSCGKWLTDLHDFGVVGQVDPRMCSVGGGTDRATGMGKFGVDMGWPIVISGTCNQWGVSGIAVKLPICQFVGSFAKFHESDTHNKLATC